MSENDLRFDSSQRWSPSISVATSQTLSEVEEGAGGIRAGEAARTNRKKAAPPPRPPPPKWEQFHRRRASHHALFSSSSSSSSSSAAPHSIQPPSSYETSRQRSYSLPPERQEAPEGCPRCSCSQAQAQEHGPSHLPSSHKQDHPFSHSPPSSQNHAQAQDVPFTVAPPSPMFSRRAFRPVAPPQRERERELRGSTYGGEQVRVEAMASLPPRPPPENSINR